MAANKKWEAARYLADRGLRVFPIKEGAKHPPLVKFKTEATTDPGQIQSWWTQYPNANIGIHCEDLLVLDVDPKRDGRDSLKQLLNEAPAPWPNSLKVTTPSGGHHYYFRCPGGVSNSVDKLAPGIDVRSTGGYVVGPGSVIPDGRYRVFDKRDIRRAPTWLIGLCASPRLRESRQKDGDGPTHASNAEIAAQRARAWLEKADPAIEGQGGDARTFKIVARVRDMGVAEDDALEVLSEWNARCEPPWDADELQRKIENVYRYAQNKAGADSVESMFDVVENPPAPEPPSTDDSELYGPDDVQLDSVLATNYIIKGWLNRGAKAMLFGQWGAGKTFLSLHMAACIAAGEEWFGHRVRPQGVLYAGYEGSAALGRRLYALRHENPNWDMSQFMVRPLRHALVQPRGGDAKVAGQAELERALRAFKARTGAYPGLIAIDPLRNALGGSDSDPALTAPFLNYMSRLIKATGAGVLIIHHPGHMDADRGRGDSGLEADVDTVIKVDGARGLVETRKQRDEADAHVHYRLRVVELGEDEDGDMLTTCVAEHVDPNPMDPGLTDTARKVLEALRSLIGADGTLTKTVYNQIVSDLPKKAQAETWTSLLQKGYIVPEGRKWKLGEGGAAELFEDQEDLQELM